MKQPYDIVFLKRRLEKLEISEDYERAAVIFSWIKELQSYYGRKSKKINTRSSNTTLR